MKTVRIVEGLGYPKEFFEDIPTHYLLTCEIAARLEELDELMPASDKASGGVRLISRLAAVERRSNRAYRLIIDMLGKQDSLSLSYEELGAKTNNSRQAWLQNAQADVKIVKEVWPEIGEAMELILKRRGQKSSVRGEY